MNPIKKPKLGKQIFFFLKDGFLKFKIKFINPILYIHFFFFYNLIEPASDWVNQIPYIQKFHVDLPGIFSAITFTPQIVNTQKLYLIWFAIRDFVHRKNLLKQIKKVTQFRNFILTHETNPPPTRYTVWWKICGSLTGLRSS